MKFDVLLKKFKLNILKPFLSKIDCAVLYWLYAFNFSSQLYSSNSITSSSVHDIAYFLNSLVEIESELIWTLVL